MFFYTATEPRLIFTNRYYIRELSIDGSEYTLLQQGFRKAVAVDFDVIQQQLYIVDYDVTTSLAPWKTIYSMYFHHFVSLFRRIKSKECLLMALGWKHLCGKEYQVRKVWLSIGLQGKQPYHDGKS